MKVHFGNSSKVLNSTHRPDVSTWVTIDCQLKEDTSIMAPVLRVTKGTYNIKWNYCYVEDWEKYYFVHNATITIGSIWEITLGIDVLATWRDEIMNSTCYVGRSASRSAVYLPDTAWRHTSNTDITVTNLGFNTMSSSPGTFAITVANGYTSNNNPSQATYLMTPARLKEFITFLYSDVADSLYQSVTSGMDATSEVITKAFFDPFQYITACTWFPTAFDTIVEKTNALVARKVVLGKWAHTMSAAVALADTPSIQEVVHFKVGDYKNWTDRSSDWVTIDCKIPGFGQFSLSPEIVGRNMSLHLAADVITGDASIYIKEGDRLFQSVSGKFGCPIKLNGITQDLNSFTSRSGIIQGITNAATSLVLGSMAANGQKDVDFSNPASAIATMKENSINSISQMQQNGYISNMIPMSPTQIGTDGNRGSYLNDFKSYITMKKYTRHTDAQHFIGGVLDEVVKLSDLSGYTEVIQPKILIHGTEIEKSLIDTMLRNGFYLES